LLHKNQFLTEREGVVVAAVAAAVDVVAVVVVTELEDRSMGL
jgi:hypothetical protein